MRNANMKDIVFLGICLFLVFLTGPAWAQENWQRVESQIDKERERAEKDAALTERLVTMDRAAMQKELEKLKSEEKSRDRDRNLLINKYNELLKLEEKLKAELVEEEAEVVEVEGQLRTAAKEAESMIRRNQITAEVPERIQIIADLRDPDKVPGLEGIQSLIDVYFDELRRSGQITLRAGDFVGIDGRMTTGQILRAGAFTTYFRMPDGQVGFLEINEDGDRLQAVTGEVEAKYRKAVKAYFDHDSNELPVDMSRGGAFASMTQKDDLRDQFEAGGPLMWPILIVACLAILIMIERFALLYTTKANTDTITDRISKLAESGNWKQAKIACDENERVPTCRMLASAVGNVGATQEVLENTLQEAILRETPRLERFLPTLGVLGTIAPLLGLLGTVTGMINTFKVITAQGTGDPSAMAGGISEALLTTKFGLAVAIPIMLIHHLLSRRVDKIVGDMEEKGTAFAVTMIKSGAVIPSEAEESV
jgi:biopolymer transport protein ExbB